MKRFSHLLLLLALLFVAISGSRVQAQGAGTLLDTTRADTRFATFVSAVEGASLTDLLSANGPFTLFAPTEAAFAKLPADMRTGILNNPTQMRHVVLQHLVAGRLDSDALAAAASVNTTLGQTLTVSPSPNGLVLNNLATLTETNLGASNGIIHVIDTVLVPDTVANQYPSGGDGGAAGGGDAGGGDAGAAGGGEAPAPPVDPSIPPPPDADFSILLQPFYNGKHVSGGHITYWAGIQAPRQSCKGMSWLVMRQMDGVTQVGSDRHTNPYRGDTDCNEKLPVLCIVKDGSAPPTRSTYGHDYRLGWANGRVAATARIRGTSLTSQAAADAICAQSFGPGWQMAEFHDGDSGYGGWELWAYGGLPMNTRFWVNINDQLGNPWNSLAMPEAPPIMAAPEVPWEGADPAFGGLGRRSMGEALAQGRNFCKGMTWSIHRQMSGLVKVGADRITNPWLGDTPCTQSLPVLCIRVPGFAVPPNSNGNNYANNWSGGIVKMTGPIAGTALSSYRAATQVCSSIFGAGWRIASFHDGSLGQGGVGAWDFWAYGGLQPGSRFWIAIYDQGANPWDFIRAQ